MAAKAAPALANDGLQNVVSGAGTSADKQAYNRWSLTTGLVQVEEVEAAYRSSWLARKIHDLPPFDMTREWRDWQAGADEITALEAEERRLGLRRKIKDALVWSRLWGGAALVLGLPGDVAMPANPGAMTKGGLKYVHVLSRYQLSIPELDLDITSDFFMQPKHYVLTGTGAEVRIHPSRVIPFVGQPLPPSMVATPRIDMFWGDPLWQTIRDAVTNASLTHEGIASLIQEAKVDTISIPGLMELVATTAGEAKVMRRLNVANLAKSITNSRVMDAAEKWETRQLSFTGLPDVLKTFLEVVAGAADIPLTRLLGTAPKGLNATGESDAANYDLMIAAKQEVELRPNMERIDDFLVPSALGSTPDDISWQFAPLSQLTEKEQADMAKTKAEASQIYINSGCIPDKAMAKAVQNQLVEDGIYPGLEDALAEAEAAGNLPPIEEAGAVDPSALTMGPDGKPLQPAENAPQTGPGKVTQPPKAAANDAEPRPLYVRRDVINHGDLTAWAKGQGFKTTLGATMHVTILFSRTPVDWLKMGETWNQDPKGQLTVSPGGPRLVENLGAQGAVVLEFASSDLTWRHCSMLQNGASSDYGDYVPHVTITYDPGDVDLAKVEPYRGKIILGPEVFEALDDNWTSSITEE